MKAKQPANIILEHESSEDEVASSEEEESEDESDNESDDHYKIYPKTELDDDIIEIVSHKGTVLKVNWRDKEENPDPKIDLPLLWADYPHTVSMYRLKKKLVGKHIWWRNPTRELVEELVTIISHKGNINNPSKCKFEVLCDNGYRMGGCTYAALLKDDRTHGTKLVQTYLDLQKK